MSPGLVLSLLLAAPSPAEFFGFRPGDDRVLADWNEAVRYFTALDAASERVAAREVGKTTEGRPFLVVTITSPENFARLEAIRADNLRLYDPRGLGDVDAAAILARGKTIVALNHGIHATEVAASQTAMETAHWLATAQDADTLGILRDTVVLMLPSHNPDGMQRVTEWYRRTLGTPYEGESPPFLYQSYTGHDNNRDWYMFTQAESRLTVAHLYDRWRPQIVHDLHQMGHKAARLFVPPYADPWEPNIDPALTAATNALGQHVAAVLTSEGRTGVVTRAIYDAWSPSRAYPFTHGGIRFLSECASAKLGTPVQVLRSELEPGLGYDPRRQSWNFPSPWPGGSWRVRDIMDYQFAATRAVLQHAARQRDFWLRNFLGVNRRAVTRREPYAWVIPSEGDAWARAKLLDALATGGVELKRATTAFDAGGQRFTAGAWIVPMQQPASAFAKSVLETQVYPDVRPHPGAPLQKPYDVTAHTLPLLLGVAAIAVPETFEATGAAVPSPAVDPGRVEGRGRAYALGHGVADLVSLARLLAAGVAVGWSEGPFEDRGRRFAAGSLLVPASARTRLDAVVRETGAVAQGISAAPLARRLGRPRVGLYQSYNPAMDEGWTRFVLEKQVGLAFDTLTNDAVRRGDLRARFDAIVLPDEAPKEILEGRAPGSLPEPYTGGIGEAGVTALRRFVEAGGTLVALNGASLLPVEDFDLGVVNALPKPAEGEEPTVVAPGSILRATVALPQHPLAHGLGATTPVWFEDSPAFDVKRGAVVLRYDEASPLLSGYLSGGAQLVGRAGLVEAPLGKGRVVLFGFRPQYRAQSLATYVPFLNALFLSASRAVPQ